MSAPRSTALRPRKEHRISLTELVGVAQSKGPESDGGVAVHTTSGDGTTVVTGITLDSRLVRPGDLYVALAGRNRHGAAFASEAVGAGAVAVLTDSAGARLASGLDQPVIVTDDPRQAMAPMAARIYGNPSESMTMLGITGTNGKTTTSFLLAAALSAAGFKTGVIGTIGFLLDGAPLEGVRTTVTTPEAPELQALLAVMAEGGAEACVMEVSSHALSLGRVDAITFDVAAFTNFGSDHLDFHGDLAAYFEAKASLFTPEHSRRAVVNTDDPDGARLADRIRQSGVLGLSTISLTEPTADYLVVDLTVSDGGGSVVSLRAPERTLRFALALPGEFNVRNAVTALAMLDVCGVDLDRAAEGLATAQVPGRMQRVDLGSGAPTVFVDFAHTPQAVAAALHAVRDRRCVVVLGCGGDRDPDKRGPIGAAAAAAAAVVVVTDDNPRTEDPAAIRAAVLAGAQAAKDAAGLSTVIVDGGDRRSAIRHALTMATSADVLAVLGKGHETGQEVNGETRAFSDPDVLRDEWASLHGASSAAGGAR